MKQVFLLLFISVAGIAAAQPGGTSGYTRGGAEATMKFTKILFEEPFIFSKGSLNIPGDKGNNKPAVLEALAESDKVIQEYGAKITEFLNSKPTAVIIKNSFNKVTSKAHGLQYAIQKAAEGYNEWRTLSSVSFLQELYLYQAFLAGAMRVYPEAISLQEKYDEATAAIKVYGSREDYMAKMEKNQQDYAKNMRLKKAVFNDASLEASAKKQYEAAWAVDKVTVVKVNITSSWVIEKNLLDIPLHKEVEVNFAIKKADGSCAFAAGYMRSVYEGGGRYSAASLIMPGAPQTAPCENLTK
ncbi:MAG: hypothetical protein JNM19_02590 [Chitinophagaceae bacterium]|nr:hypothetical protein [Chitinophagaceae bacterium]